MSVMLRTALIIISALTLWYTARKIRKSQLQIEDSISGWFFQLHWLF